MSPWLRHVLAAWRSLRRAELFAFLLPALGFGLVNLTVLADATPAAPLVPLATRLLLSPVLAIGVLLLAWLPADRSAPASPWRPWRMGLAALLGSLAAVPVVWAVSEWLGWPGMEAFCGDRCGPPLPLWQELAGDFLATFLPAVLLVAVIELWGRRLRADAQLQALLAEQAALGRQAMAARLAAMQAQVEPQFLFDVLVDVQQQYARGETEPAAAQLERLIHHLRVALPRLREQNTTQLDAECALLASYLALREGLAHRPVNFDDQLPATLRSARLPAMLLLPLLQRALRLAPDLPAAVSLRADALANGLVVRLTVACGGLCGDDAELAAQAQRLQVLAGPAARLHCQAEPASTCFTLELPA